jgi:cytidyltransferase-like protein
MSTIALITGGFDLLHSGHLALIKSAREMSPIVAIGLNSDAWLYRKKGYVRMSFSERKEILESIEGVHKVFGFSDLDNTACRAIQKVAWIYERPVEKIIFCNGGDRTEDNIPEMNFQPLAGRPEDPDPILEFAFGVGGTDKKNSSSELVKIQRDWGYWQVLKDYGTTKVKELTIFPGKKISYQRHFKRSELWFVVEGECTIRGLRHEPVLRPRTKMKLHAYENIPVGMWHDIENHTDKLCRIVEIQYGEACEEIDIERHK